jgi:DNA-directed RNA polymerase specialized sigma24 family protein
MATTVQQVRITHFAVFSTAASKERDRQYQTFSDSTRHHIYTLGFWMTGNELAAEELLRDTVRRALAKSGDLSPEALDGALICELRERMPLGGLTLEEAACGQVVNLRRNPLRVHLEQAVVQLPPTERLVFLLHDVEGYEHARIARMLGLSENESRYGLHQARLRLRQLLARLIG